MLEKIEGNQGAEIVKYHLKLMRAQRDRLEQELQDNMEKHNVWKKKIAISNVHLVRTV
jgi:hypothetical protein